MQRTEKYFEQDAFRTQCESIILAAEQALGQSRRRGPKGRGKGQEEAEGRAQFHICRHSAIMVNPQ